MNRPPHVHGFPRPPLALVGHEHPVGGSGTSPAHPGTAPPGSAPGEAADAALRAELRERTADLQRLKAEYDNYRKRVRRDRQAVAEIAVSNVLSRLLPVLDALAEATAQGEVTDGFARVARALETELGSLGLQSVAAPGAPFDPTLHEAVTCTHTDRVTCPTCAAVLRQGYRVGGQLLRPAEVVVAAPDR
ncbi:nucleotide exchange factor GrpE [Streptomyces lydicus]|uniref:nucleotide exchange factor GrpE n=1 Tax=Streptomyces lydicus TaxID=47763 RepID=UPI0037A67688